MNIIYSHANGQSSENFNQIRSAIRRIIEEENDSFIKKRDSTKTLFQIEGSVNFEKHLTCGIEDDDTSEKENKFIEHIPFMKEFSIPKNMQETSCYNVAADAKRRVENFVRSYHKTARNLLEYVISHGTKELGRFNGATLDLTAPDGLPLFSELHKYGTDGKTQSNLLYEPITDTLSNATFSETLSKLAKKLSDMKDEHGEKLGYKADTIIIPGNRIKMENVIKKTIKDERDIGNYWDLVIFQSWYSDDDRMIIMSSEANEELGGNMFFNRVPLVVSSWEDKHTGNYIWNGRCRFGVGFGSYKHILMAVDSATVSKDKDK